MVKRPAEAETPSERLAKKVKAEKPPNLKNARDLHLILAFHQDAHELRKGRLISYSL
jgi:hypothetical protein